METIPVSRLKPGTCGVCNKHLVEFLQSRKNRRIYRFAFGDSYNCSILMAKCDHVACRNDMIIGCFCSEVRDRILDKIECYQLIDVETKTYDTEPDEVYYYAKLDKVEHVDIEDALDYYQLLHAIKADGCGDCVLHVNTATVRLGELLNFGNITCDRHALDAIERDVFYSNNMAMWERFNRKRYACEHPECAKNPFKRRQCFEASKDSIMMFDVKRAHISFDYATRGEVSLDITPRSKFGYPDSIRLDAEKFFKKIEMYHDPTCRLCECKKQNVAGMRGMMHFMGVLERDGWKFAGDD